MSKAVGASGRSGLSGLSGLFARTPLRVRLVVALLSLVLLALVILGVTGTALLRRDLLERVDGQLQATAAPMVERIDRGSTALPPQRGPGPQLPNEYYLEIKDEAGQTSEELAPNIGNINTPTIPPLRPDELSPDGELLTVTAQQGDTEWRAFVVPVRNETASLTVATPLDEVDETVAQLRNIQLVVGLLVLLLLGWLAYYLVRASLRPLVDVERTAGAIATGDLSRRVPDRDPRTEVGRLSRALNGMLQQIETAFRDRAASEAAARQSEERMRRFVADASHELRTPLTSIRGFAELYRQGAAPGPLEAARIMRRIEDESRRMGLLVEDLLLLARLDQQRPLERRPVDLIALAADAVHDARVVAPDRPVTLRVLDGAGDSEDSPAPIVLGDEARLRQVVGNLVTNAQTHTPPGTPVTVSVGSSPAAGDQQYAGHTAVLDVADAGPGLAPEHAGRVFERFYRADASRTRASQGALKGGGQGSTQGTGSQGTGSQGTGSQGTGSQGTGLGLSIVAALVAAHGGTVTLTTAPGKGAAFRVQLPLATDGASAVHATHGSRAIDDSGAAGTGADGSFAPAPAPPHCLERSPLRPHPAPGSPPHGRRFPQPGRGSAELSPPSQPTRRS